MQPPKKSLFPELRKRLLLSLMFACAMFLILLSPMTAAPASASFSIEVSGIIDGASDMFNQLFPLFGPIIGISFGLALIGWVAAKIIGALRGASK
jgi:hypothetical protein